MYRYEWVCQSFGDMDTDMDSYESSEWIICAKAGILAEDVRKIINVRLQGKWGLLWL